MSNTTIDWLATGFTTASWAVNQICVPVFFLIGIVGWALNTITFSRSSLRSNSCATYFHASSWANLCVLCWALFVNVVGNLSGYRLISKSVLFCKMRIYFITMFCHASVAFLLLACFDRLLLCSRNANRRRLCHVRVAYKMIIIAFIVCALLPLYIPFTYNRLAPVSNICIAIIEVSNFDVIYKVTVWAVVPPSLMLIFGGLTIHKLRQNARRIANVHIRIHRKDRQLIAMVIGQITLYIRTTWPYVTVLVYNRLTQNIPSSDKSSARIAVEAFALSFSAGFFLYVFNAISFLVYTLTAPSFHRELLMALVPRTLRPFFANQVGTIITVHQNADREGRTLHISTCREVTLK